ncbi:pyridoxamine 5'-phosphate oxidase family protein [Algihabitans albus]|uniref:pyridoxamine 5'-phosphate oxidase family protein n=1 Tax=Algihabitans albus TaxID=2164067 RepID=UPI000E5C5E9A|nr:pyridoxamine 5'-phosphate oxidase family protein [Algihabitans albus]
MTDAIGSLEALRDRYGAAKATTELKRLARLDEHCRAFIAASPFVVLGTSDAEGNQDVSPRGDPPGFVRVLDETRLLLPDRPGNKLIDSLSNVLANPKVGLLFMVPGMNETLRVNGRAQIVTDPALLEPLAVEGRLPPSALLIEVEEAYLHCAKAFIRSKLWDPDRQIDRKSFPSLGRMIADQIAGLDAEKTEAGIQESYKDRLY